MSETNKRPTTVNLIKATRELSNSLPAVTTGAVFGNDMHFHPNGLYSVEIFGEVGSENRSVMRGKIDLNCTVFNPTIHRLICDLGALYVRIMEGKQTAIFDEKAKDFKPDDGPKAKTGFSFFMKHYKDLRYRRTGSMKRDKYIELIYKSQDAGTDKTDFMPVIPAAYRDYQHNDHGKSEEDEINDLYRTLMSRSSLMDPVRSRTMPEVFDQGFLGVQQAVDAIDMYIEEITKGDTKLIGGKFVARKIFNTTSNVISSHVEKSKGLRDPRFFRINQVRMPLYQFLRACAPLTTFNIKLKYMSKMISTDNNLCYLTNVKTFKREEVSIRSVRKELDLWVSNDGIDKSMSYVGNIDMRRNPVLFKGETLDGNKGVFTLGLLYRNKTQFKFLQDIDEIPPHMKEVKHTVEPVSLFEFMYMSVFGMNNKYPTMSTRYPVSGEGSIYPAYANISTTIETDILRELDENWMELEGDEYLAINFPRKDSEFINTYVIGPEHIGKAGADFDGDQMHAKVAMAVESQEEVANLLKTRRYYIGDDNQAVYSRATNVLDAVIKTMSR